MTPPCDLDTSCSQNSHFLACTKQPEHQQQPTTKLPTALPTGDFFQPLGKKRQRLRHLESLKKQEKSLPFPSHQVHRGPAGQELLNVWTGNNKNRSGSKWPLSLTPVTSSQTPLFPPFLNDVSLIAWPSNGKITCPLP